MWRLASRLFLGIAVASILTNALAVYVLHDVDADRLENLNLAYRELMLEFLVFAIVFTATFLLFGWIVSLILRLRIVNSSSIFSFVLGMAVILIQYPAEYLVRKLNADHTSDRFLLGYLLLTPVCCVAIVFLDAHRRRSIN